MATYNPGGSGTNKPMLPGPFRPPATMLPGPFRPPAPMLPGPFRPSSNKSVAPASQAPISNYGTSGSGNITPVSPAPPASPPPAPVTPSVDQWLAGDSVYQTQNDALSKAVADYLAQATASGNTYNGQYDTNTSAVGDARLQGNINLKDDYASRGLMTSGLYAKGYSDLQSDYDKKQAQLDTEKANFGSQLATGIQNFNTDSGIKRTSAQTDAINRRTAKYNL